MTQPSFARMPEFLTWQEVDKLIDHLVPQLTGHYDGLLMITRGGIVPGGLLAEALDIRFILTAAVEFATTSEPRLAWPNFLQFPEDALLVEKRILVVDDIWENGRTITTVTGRIQAAGGRPETAVLHFKPGNSLFRESGPNYYAAITDRFVVYPWETERGRDLLRRSIPGPN